MRQSQRIVGIDEKHRVVIRLGSFARSLTRVIHFHSEKLLLTTHRCIHRIDTYSGRSIDEADKSLYRLGEVDHPHDLHTLLHRHLLSDVWIRPLCHHVVVFCVAD